MKKQLLIFITATLFSTSVFSQTVSPDTTKKEFKNSIGLDVTYFIRQFTFSNGGPNYYYNFPSILTYRRIIKSNAIRISLGGYVNNNDGIMNDTLKEKNSRSNYNIRLGFERYFYIGKKWMGYFGPDLVAGYTEFGSEHNSPSEKYKMKQETYSYGISPFLGITFQINSRLSIASEASYDLIYNQLKESRNWSKDPDRDRLEKNNGITTAFSGPQLINLRLKF